MRKLRYTLGDILVARHTDERGKRPTAKITRVDPNAGDNHVYFTESTDGTKRWWMPAELTTDFRHPKPGELTA